MINSVNKIKFLIGISFSLIFIGGLPLVVDAQAASFYLSPTKGNYGWGRIFL